MTNTSSRLLRLLSLLQTHRFWPGAELADRLEISARTLRRDVDRLRELGYPVDAQRGVEGGYQLAAGAAMPPLLLDDEEAVALALGLRLAAQGTVAGIEETAVRALAKVVQVMPPRLRRRVDALRAAITSAVWTTGGGPLVDAGTLALIAQACRDEERLRFVYAAPDGQTTPRHVEPHRLVSLGRRWYLVAYDLRRDDWRTFRVDRIQSVRSTEVRFEPRRLPAADAVAFVRASVGTLPASYVVEALVRAPAEVVRASVGPWASVEDVGDGECRLQMRSDNLDWPTLALGAVRAEFEVLSPPELKDHLNEWAARFSRATASTSSRPPA